MAIFKGNGFAADGWRHLEPGEDLSPEGGVILTLPHWQAIRAQVRGDRPFGLLVEPGQDVQAIAPDLSQFALIEVAFPKFTDGRGYSLARKLRGSYGFNGQLRAAGEILFDQLQFLARCGFDSFDIKDAATIRLLEKGHRPRFSMFYQPGLGPEIPEQTRPWARRAAS
ncbi:MAG TPA: DUF934 domain-containing protein [Methylocella sp.]|nr:DUF934 domain-containing protein [Methylocella sp.]